MLLALVATTSCMTGRINQMANADLEQVHKRTREGVIDARCVTLDGVGPNCGLLARQVTRLGYRQRFNAEHCQEVSAETCDDRFDRMVAARLQLRYAAADFDGVRRDCDANVEHCENLFVYENNLLNSHNARLQRDDDERALEIEQQRRDDLAFAEYYDPVMGLHTSAAILSVVARAHPIHYR